MNNQTLLKEVYQSLQQNNELEKGQTLNHLLQIYEACHEFVEKTCAGRDKSHGLIHMLKVTNNALNICFQMVNNNTTGLTYRDVADIIVVAMFHDVADHKYDLNGQLETIVKEELTQLSNKFHTSHTKSLWFIINNISFSKEKAAGSLKNVFLSAEGELPVRMMIVRKVVSDADRLEAIGEEGIKRCISYVQHKNPSAKQKEIIESVVIHAKEKLLILPFEDPITKEPYFHTNEGKAWALKLHKGTLDGINKIGEYLKKNRFN